MTPFRNLLIDALCLWKTTRLIDGLRTAFCVQSWLTGFSLYCDIFQPKTPQLDFSNMIISAYILSVI